MDARCDGRGGLRGPGPAPADGTYYGTLVDGDWVTERITKATGMTSLVLDTDTGTVHVLVNGNPNKEGGGRLRHYERAPGGGWTSTPLRPGPRGAAAWSSGVTSRTARSSSCSRTQFEDRVQMMTRR